MLTDVLLGDGGTFDLFERIISILAPRNIFGGPIRVKERSEDLAVYTGADIFALKAVFDDILYLHGFVLQAS